ncbi:MAG: M42 family metallopeptidase [Ruminococcaceae bacterium]|nr:M42 family metallopeptidase [Oscillospiraceae bacterium]
MSLYNTLKELCLCPSVSGREGAIRERLIELIAPLCDEYRVDALGNLIAHKKGSGEKVMLAAHMDEIGFIVNFIEDNGMIRIAPVGGVSLTAAAYSTVVSEKGVKGTVVPDDKVKPADFKADAFYIDIGATSKKRAEALVEIGDFFVVTPNIQRLSGGRICGRPMDDRVGCAVLVEIARDLADKQVDKDIYYVFSVQEEVGCRGAMTAAYAIAPDVALCFDVTATGDVPGATPMACKLGGGAAVKIKDASVICSEKITSELCRLAEENGVKYQREILTYGGTDTSAMQLAGSGAAVGALSIPTRYIHTPTETFDLSDAEACVKLAELFLTQRTK